MNCTGSVALIESLPVEPSSSYALLGTYAHEVAEAKLKTFLNHKITGEPLSTLTPTNSAFDDYDLEKVDMATDLYVKAVWEEVLKSSITGKAYGFEDKFTLNEKLAMWGYLDFWCIYISDKTKRTGVVVDYKNGYTPVSVDKNAQLAFYACALRKFVRDGEKDLDEVRCVIFQPNKAFGKAYSECKYTSKQLDAWEKKFSTAAHKILIEQKAKLKAGAWCEFCRAQAVCTAYSKQMEKSTSLKIIDVESLELPIPETLSDEQLSRLVKYSSELEDYLKAVKNYALQRFQGGKPITGLKMVMGSTKRCWRDNEEEIGEALVSMGITNPWNKKLLGIVAAEKLIGKGRIQDLCTTTVARELIVPDSDERESVAGHGEMFKVLSESGVKLLSEDF
jgi:hypothetical protein